MSIFHLIFIVDLILFLKFCKKGIRLYLHVHLDLFISEKDVFVCITMLFFHTTRLANL